MRDEHEIEALVRAFEAATLPLAEWHHVEHLTVALWYLRRFPRAEATAQIREGIRAYNAAQGVDPAGYHETLTLAWIALISRFLAERDHGQPQSELTAALLAEYADKRRVLEHYSRERILSPEARATWVEPDLRPFSAPASPVGSP